MAIMNQVIVDGLRYLSKGDNKRTTIYVDYKGEKRTLL